MDEKLKTLRVGVTSFVLALSVPGFALAGDLTDAMQTTITETASEILVAGGMLMAIVGSIVAVRAIINVFKRGA